MDPRKSTTLLALSAPTSASSRTTCCSGMSELTTPPPSPCSPRSTSSRVRAFTSQSQQRVVAHDGQDDGQITLSPRKQAELFDTINATVTHVLESMVGDRPSSVYWKPKLHRKDVAYYVDDNVNSDQYRFCCVGETSASTEDVMQLFQMTDTHTLLKNNRVVYNNILDAQVLSVLEHPTPQNPYKSVYVRYSSFAAPTLMDNRDMCVVVATDVFTHDDGSTVGYCLWDSVDLAECPDYYESHGLVRSRMFRSGFFMRTTKSTDSTTATTQTKIVYLIGLEAGGLAPRLTARLVMDKFGANLTRLCQYFRRRQLDPKTFCARADWPNKKCTTNCRVCEKKFGALSSRTHCAACGNVVCKACYSKENVDMPGVGITQMRFCWSCLGERGIEPSAGKTRTLSRAMMAASSSSSSSSSSHRSRTRSYAEMTTIDLPYLLKSLSTSELDAYAMLSKVSISENLHPLN